MEMNELFQQLSEEVMNEKLGDKMKHFMTYGPGGGPDTRSPQEAKEAVKRMLISMLKKTPGGEPWRAGEENLHKAYDMLLPKVIKYISGL